MRKWELRPRAAAPCAASPARHGSAAAGDPTRPLVISSSFEHRMSARPVPPNRRPTDGMAIPCPVYTASENEAGREGGASRTTHHAAGDVLERRGVPPMAGHTDLGAA